MATISCPYSVQRHKSGWKVIYYLPDGDWRTVKKGLRSKSAAAKHMAQLCRRKRRG